MKDSLEDSCDEERANPRIPPPLDYASKNAQPRKPKLVSNLLFGFVTMGILLLAIGVVFPFQRNLRGRALTVMCASQLRQIGQGLTIYCNKYGGRYPDYLEQLLYLDMTAQVFVCPNSIETVAPRGNSPEADVAAVANQPGHVSYTYVGRGLTNRASPYTVVAYEPVGHHPAKEGQRIDGSNVLFADGRVVFVAKADLAAMIQELATGANPPPIAKRLHISAGP